MVPEHRKHARARSKPAEHLRHRLDVVARSGYEVPGHGNQVGFKFVSEFDDCSERFGREIQPMMKIRQVHDAEAAESLRKAFEGHRVFADFNRTPQTQSPELAHPVRLS